MCREARASRHKALYRDRIFSASAADEASLPRQRPPRLVTLLTPCHLDRLRGSEATERERRDPETASSTILIRGVLPKQRVVCCAHPPRLNQTRVCCRAGVHSKLRVYILWPESGNALPGIVIRVECPESATRRRHSRDLSTPPQSLRFFVVGRDDSSLLLSHFSAPSSAAAKSRAEATIRYCALTARFRFAHPCLYAWAEPRPF